MHISPAGLSLVKKWEGFSAIPYRDAAGLWTIGYGHLIKPGETFARITAAEAEALLARDVVAAERVVEAAVKVPLTQNQFDSLTSFTFNLGSGKAGYKDGFVWLKSGGHSSLLTLLNQGNTYGASMQFGRWVKADGKVLRGLVARREEERQLFMKA